MKLGYPKRTTYYALRDTFEPFPVTWLDPSQKSPFRGAHSGFHPIKFQTWTNLPTVAIGDMVFNFLNLSLALILIRQVPVIASK